MIQAKDLRIGNWVNYHYSENETIPCKIDAQDIFNISNRYMDNHKIHSPMPLTEELLIKCGFKKINHIHGYSFWAMGIKGGRPKIDIYESRTEYMGYSVKHVQYLHQIQNLYFTLTGPIVTGKQIGRAHV